MKLMQYLPLCGDATMQKINPSDLLPLFSDLVDFPQ